MVNNQSSALDVRVYIEDTDAGGIVFYANYLKYFERGRTEFFRERGFELRQGLSENINYVVHSLTVHYKRSAYLDDLLTIKTELQRIGKTYLVFNQQANNNANELLVSAEVKIACLHFDTGKPRRLPEKLIASI